jgi:hypothetical protein
MSESNQANFRPQLSHLSQAELFTFAVLNHISFFIKHNLSHLQLNTPRSPYTSPQASTMSIRQTITPVLARRSSNAKAPTAALTRPVAANMHTAATTSAPGSSASHTRSFSSASTVQATSAPNVNATGAPWTKASGPAVETWWGNRPCPTVLNTPNGTLFDGPARPSASRQKMRWDFEDHVEPMVTVTA